MRSKLAIGTVQFGLKYGIAEQAKMVDYEAVCGILDFAEESGVEFIDTAHAYGSSEDVLGQYFYETGNAYNIVSKLSPWGEMSPEAYFEDSLKRLGQKKLYAYLFHHLKTWQDHPEYLDVLMELKKKGKITKVGFSLYSPEDVEMLIENQVPFDILQFPYSVLDQRWEKVMPMLKEMDVELHIRSVFLQGLVFRDPLTLHPHFHSAKGSIQKIHHISKLSGYHVADLALAYVLMNKNIDRVVLGIDSKNVLELNLKTERNIVLFRDYFDELKALSVADEKVLLPVNWPKDL